MPLCLLRKKLGLELISSGGHEKQAFGSRRFDKGDYFRSCAANAGGAVTLSGFVPAQAAASGIYIIANDV